MTKTETETRYIAQCRCCKAVWSFTYDRQRGGNCDEQAVWHHTCEGFDKRRAAGWDDSMIGCNSVTVNQVRWRRRPDGSTSKCGARCIQAKGGDCDCQCGGKNHGSGH